MLETIEKFKGNEATSKELLLHFIDYMLNDQYIDPTVDYIMKRTRIHILVSMNPGILVEVFSFYT